MYERFKQLLDEKHIKVSQVSRETGIAPSTLSDWKNGKSTPKYDKMKRIAEYFNVDVEWLSGESDQMWKTENINISEFSTDDNSKENFYELYKNKLSEPVSTVGIKSNLYRLPIFSTSSKEITYEYISACDKDMSLLAGLIYNSSNMEPQISQNSILIFKKANVLTSNKLNVLYNIKSSLFECYNIIKLGNGYMLESYNQLVPMQFISYEDFKQSYKVIGTVIRSIQRH